MVSTTTFADLQGRRATDRKRCKSCGGGPLAGVVRIEARSYGPEPTKDPLRGGRVLASLSLSLCEPCVVRRYLAVESALDSLASDETQRGEGR